MNNEHVVNELVRMSIDLEFKKGQPPEEAIRIALEQVLIALARNVKTSTSKNYFFPIVFPMIMTLESEQIRWDFRIICRLKNAFEEKKS